MAALKLRRVLWQQMMVHVQRCLPEEACGLIAGRGNRAAGIYPVTNALHSPVQFSMVPQEQLSAMLAIEQHGWDLIAIYHSHPAGPDHPSPTDLAEFAYPGSLYLIWSCQEEVWGCKAYRLDGGEVETVDLELQE